MMLDMEESFMKKLFIILVCLCCLVPLSQATLLNRPQKTLTPSQASFLDGGWVEEKDNITILHVSGSHYEMGYQHGYLLQEKVQQDIRAFLHYAEQYLPLSEFLGYWNLSKAYVPAEYVEEIHGIADGANISFNDIVTAIMAIEYADHGCYGIAAWGTATNDGQMYHARSFDLPSTIQDPVSGRYAHENTVLVVRDPDNGTASISPAIAGSFHTGGGMNANGVCLGIQICWSKDQTFEGDPYHFRVQEVLDSATTAQDALDILNTNRTHGFNFIVSQATPAIGYALEQTANLTYIGSYDNYSVESHKPFWAIDHVVRRTNVFLEPTIAATQRTPYNPAGLIAFLKLLVKQQTNPYFAVFQLYQSVSKQIYVTWGNLSLNTTLQVLRDGYRAEDFPLLRLIERLGKGTGMAEAWNQWVACPATGGFVFSFANHDQMAFRAPTHYVNFYDLLSQSPP
jgi:hypothetical protein